MIIHVYSIMRNEAQLLPYFLRYYETFADKIFIFDDHSSDRTVEIARTCNKVQILDFNHEEGIREKIFSRCLEDAYKQHSRGVADWVMTVDGDEFLYNKNIRTVLENQTKLGNKVIKAVGYNMMSEKFPTTKGQIYEECFMGDRTHLFDKTILFNPEIDVEFGNGRHKTELPENVHFVKANILLLHFRFLSRDFIISRYKHVPTFSEKHKQELIERALNYHESCLKSGKLTNVLASAPVKKTVIFQTRNDLAQKFTGIGAEIGVEQGEFSEIICQSDKVKKLYSIDAWKAYRGFREHTSQQKLDNFYEISKMRLKPYNCELVRKFSSDAAQDFMDNSLDFVYIDANHSYEHVYEDLSLWSKKVKSGGVVSGHDYIRRKGQDHIYGVVKAVDDFTKNNNIKELFIYKGESPASWCFIKE